jgi:DNA-binding transcriptional LysR family regulator
VAVAACSSAALDQGTPKGILREKAAASSETPAILFAAVAGLGLAYVPADMAQPYLNEGVLESVCEDWCLPYSGYHLYYPSRRQSSPAFALLVEALRYRNRDG